MRKKIVWLILSGVMVAVLLLVSCAPAVTEEEEVIAPPEEEEEVVTEEELLEDGLPPDPSTAGVELEKHFEGSGLSFDYPEAWVSWEKASFEQMRSAMKAQGIDLIALLRAKDETCVMQVAKRRNASSFDSLYQGKKEVADEVTSEGIEIMGFRFVKYTVEVIDLPASGKAILGYAEQESGDTGISYQVLSGGYEYNINFIYESATRAAKDEELREQIVQTLKITGTGD